MRVKNIGYMAILFVFILGFSDSVFGASQPQYGGILKVVTSNGPQMMSYEPAMGPGDHSAMFPGGERLANAKRGDRSGTGVEPVLAESYEEDINNLTITWNLRKGVKFHDGTEMTAEIVKWNFQMIIDAKALPYSGYLDEIIVKDKYTVVMKMNRYNNQCLPSWGYWPIITSKAAWDKASGGDLEKGKEWARNHIVGTGPFMLDEFKRDVHLKWKKNPNYWRKGKPYLDGITMYYVPDETTANAMFLAGEIDVWEGTPANKQQALSMQGYYRQADWPALGYALWVNTATGKKWQDKTLRQAVECSINKKAIARAVGFGMYRPLKSLPPEGEWGYDASYDPYPYNPDKARRLLQEAGYSRGLKVKLMVPVFSQEAKDVGAAAKQFMEDVGFKVNLDMADPGRFFGSIYWVAPPEDLDLAYWITGRDSNYLMSYMRWFGTEPFTDVSLLAHSPQQALMEKAASKTQDTKEQELWAGILMRYITDNALVIPLFDMPVANMQQSYVHDTRYETGFTRWMSEDTWMEKH